VNTREEMQAALDEVFDDAIVFHAFTPTMRDYEIITWSGARRGASERFRRFCFQRCVESSVSSALSVETWRDSVGDALLDGDRKSDHAGFLWAVRWQCLYPGAQIVEGSERAAHWSDALGLPFHEVEIATNVHVIRLVFSGLTVADVDLGYRPFEVVAASATAAE